MTRPLETRSYQAWVWATGAIELANRRTPAGAIEIFSFADRRAALVGNAVLEVAARHAYDGKTLLVPGVPEVAGTIAATDALIAWVGWVVPRMARRVPPSRFTTRVTVGRA